MPPARDTFSAAAPPQGLHAALTARLGREPLTARSRKIFAGFSLSNRFLWTFPRDWMPADATPDSLSPLIGAEIPPEIRTHWPRADMIHIGFDGAEGEAEGAGIRKLYLEFTPESAPEAGLVYLAVKCGRAGHLNRYDTLPDAAPVLRTLALPPSIAEPAARLARQSGHLLRVAEQGSARLSLDINLSDTEPHPALSAALADLVTRVNPDAPAPACWPSHIAIGRDRTGRVFLTLYGWPWEDCP